jgi:hypothetical protein
MKKILLLFLLTSLANDLLAQYVYTIKADSVKITNCDSAELILENHTQNIPGFLFNTGNGRTIFKRGAQKLNDSTYLIGADTIKVSSNPWVQGGNAFGTIGVLGTRDNNPLDLYTNNVDQARLTTNGDLLLGSTTDSSYKLDVKGNARFGTYLGQNMVRGSLNFDNGSNAAYIMQSNSLLRSLQIPGTGGSAPWLFTNTANEGVEIADVAGTIFLAGGKVNITSTNFTSVGSIIATEPSATNNRTIYFGNTALNHANENGTNVAIVGGTGGNLANVYNGGNISINPGLQGARGANGNILMGNLVNGNVGIQTSAPNSNFEVDQGTQGSGVVITAAGGTTVTGVSTQFTNTFKVGDSITIAGQTVAITAIASDLSMTTTPTAAQDSNVTYTLTGARRFVVKGNGMVGVGVSAPTSQLDILAPSGYSQFRLRTSYTPTSSSDPNGNVGDFSWDANYMYVKTTSGWKRSALGTF